MSIRELGVLAILPILFGCDVKKTTRYPSGTHALDEGIQLHSLYYRERELLYAFATPANAVVRSTHDASTRPIEHGVHWCLTLPDGVWLNGRKVVMPKTSKVFAIRADGVIVPIELTEAELEHLAKNHGRIVNPSLNQKFVAIRGSKPKGGE